MSVSCWSSSVFHRVICCIIFVSICLVHNGLALDVSFIPNDANAPLPLSAKYRASLRRLCTLMKQYPPLSSASNHQTKNSNNILADVYNDPVKHTALTNLCKKLAADDLNIAQGEREFSLKAIWNKVTSFSPFAKGSSNKMLYILGFGGIGVTSYLFLKQKKKGISTIFQKWKRLLSGSRGGSLSVSNNDNLLNSPPDEYNNDDEDDSKPSPAALRAARLRHFSNQSPSSAN